MDINEIELVQAGQKDLEDYLRNIGYDPSIKEFKVFYKEGEKQKEIIVSNGIENIGLVKVLMALTGILPAIQTPEEQLALSSFLLVEYNKLLLTPYIKNDGMVLAALLIKRAGFLRKELMNIKSGEDMTIEIVE
jgi:hypothetical protein